MPVWASPVWTRSPWRVETQRPVGGLMTVQANALGSWPCVPIVMPTLNEARNLHVFVRLPFDSYKVIVMDGHSADSTLAAECRMRQDVRIAGQTRKVKEDAFACGFAAATADVIAYGRCERLSRSQRRIPLSVKVLLDGVDFAERTRCTAGSDSNDTTCLRRAFVNMCYSTRYLYLWNGFNIFWRRHVPVPDPDATSQRLRDNSVRVHSEDFEVESLNNIHAAAAGLVITGIPSFENPRIYGLSNPSAIRECWRILKVIIREQLDAVLDIRTRFSTVLSAFRRLSIRIRAVEATRKREKI
jgi:hypothetical protein